MGEPLKIRFYSIKHEDGRYEGTFLATSAEIAKDIAKKNGFKVDDNTVMEDTTLEMTAADRLHQGSIVSGD